MFWAASILLHILGCATSHAELRSLSCFQNRRPATVSARIFQPISEHSCDIVVGSRVFQLLGLEISVPSMTRLDWIHGCYTGQCKVALGPCLAKNLLVDLRRSSKTLVGHGPFILVPCLAKLRLRAPASFIRGIGCHQACGSFRKFHHSRHLRPERSRGYIRLLME